MKLAVVIPTYNERETLPNLVDELVSELKKIAERFFITVIDDASPDGTGRIAEDLKKTHENITVIHRKKKLGLGSAYKEGFKQVLERFNPDLIVQMDADHSHDPKEIPRMVQGIQGFDFGIASRHLLGSSTPGWGLSRKVLHNTAGLFAKMCGRLKMSDPTSGFRIFKRKVLSSIDFSQIKSDGFAFQVEVLCRLKSMGFKGIELPTSFVNRRKGRSKMSFSETLQFIKVCFSLLMNRS